jgi:hypothetical protein
MTSLKSDLYYEKYFNDGTEEGQHALVILLKDNVTRQMLLDKGFIEGDGEDYDCDFFCDEEGTPEMIELTLPMNGDVGYDDEDALPEGWEDDVPKVIGLPDEWVDDLTR